MIKSWDGISFVIQALPQLPQLRLFLLLHFLLLPFLLHFLDFEPLLDLGVVVLTSLCSLVRPEIEPHALCNSGIVLGVVWLRRCMVFLTSFFRNHSNWSRDSKRCVQRAFGRGLIGS